nr:patched domain-containing protein 3 [Columba livia]
MYRAKRARFSLEKTKSEEDLLDAFGYVMGRCREDRARTKNNYHKLYQEKFHQELVQPWGHHDIQAITKALSAPQFTPTWGPAKADRDFVQRFFPTNDSERFSAARLPTEGTYAAFIVVATGNGSVLAPAARRDVLRLDAMMRARGYEKLCAVSSGTCAIPNPLQYDEAALENLTFPFSGGLLLGTVLGGVQTDPDGRVLSARALRLLYYLREDGPAAAESRRWLESFLLELPSELAALGITAVRVTYFTSLSRQQEFEGNTKRVIPLFSITYLLTVTFSVISCLRLSCIRNNVWLACCGVVSAGLAVLSSFGLLLFCGVPFVVTVAGAPFLILGVGVDDMFIMIACWEQSSRKEGLSGNVHGGKDSSQGFAFPAW